MKGRGNWAPVDECRVRDDVEDAADKHPDNGDHSDREVPPVLIVLPGQTPPRRVYKWPVGP